ncbi:MAG: DUF3024 domain-containing protein [Desulfobulbaceae bacterium]|uniref:DUF3024 domain-containing protein n=1 Tax=Candidatus Desulfobia pelagia TaxID=2841692 RepID=A0A8J6NCW8_9BACT|nr:DUF3024 domain-containing protein [Candidatus Desulfobia pelagia]
MSLSEFEIKRIEKIVGAFIENKRPPVHIRNQLDLGYSITGQSVEIFEIRPVWNNPEKRITLPVAKATYVKKSNIWKVYWQKADLKWNGYEPNPQAKTIEQFVAIVEEDAYACFWG